VSRSLTLFNAHYDCTCFQPIHISTVSLVTRSLAADESDARVPENARASLSALVAQIASCQTEIGAMELLSVDYSLSSTPPLKLSVS
jgi:hypothetical protein